MTTTREIVEQAIVAERKHTCAALGALLESIKLLSECHGILCEPQVWAKNPKKVSVLSTLRANIEQLTAQSKAVADWLATEPIPEPTQ
jgi:hypothetical protein